MSEETRRVLELLAQGKVSVDEADQLLKAVSAATAAGSPSSTAADERPRPPARFVRIAIHKEDERQGEKDVTIRVPLVIVRSGMRLGALIPGIAGEKVAARLRDRGVELGFSTLDAAALDAVFKELGSEPIDIDAGKAQIRITCE